MATPMRAKSAGHARPPRRSRPPVVSALCVVAAMILAACDHYAAAADTEGPSLTPAPLVPSPIERSLECEGVTVDSAATTVETLRLADGSCVPATDAVVYRCDPSLDQVAVVGAGSEPQAFLGGRFAVKMSTIPAGARPIGVAGVGRLYVVPGNDRWLYVESGATYERWLELPPTSAVSDPPTVTMIGDSILDGATPALESMLTDWQPSVDAVVGRSSAGGISPALALASAPPDVVVVELGTNDHDATAFRSAADQIVTAAGGARLVMWVTAHNPDIAIAGVNREIHAVMAGLPNGAVADWDAAVPLDALSSDGIHLLAGQEAVFADFLFPLLQGWHDAVGGGGATRCGSDVLAALAD